MICRKFFILSVLLLSQIAICAEFGEYGYSKYLGVQQQLNNRRAAARIMELRQNANPTRNIRYPDAYNRYPNIQRSNISGINPYQRYSPAYYQRTYGSRY